LVYSSSFLCVSFYREISKLAGEYLKDTGYLAYEIGYNQAKDVSKILQDNNFAILSIVKDYGGNDRVIIAKKAIKADNFEKMKKNKRASRKKNKEKTSEEELQNIMGKVTLQKTVTINRED